MSAKLDALAPGTKHAFGLRWWRYRGRAKISVEPAPMTPAEAEGFHAFLRVRVQEVLEQLTGESWVRESEAASREHAAFMRGAARSPLPFSTSSPAALINTDFSLSPKVKVETYEVDDS